MGRFDALTTLDQKPVQPTPLLENGEEVPPASKPAKKQTSKEVSLFVSKHPNQQTSNLALDNNLIEPSIMDMPTKNKQKKGFPPWKEKSR